MTPARLAVVVAIAFAACAVVAAALAWQWRRPASWRRALATLARFLPDSWRCVRRWQGGQWSRWWDLPMVTGGFVVWRRDPARGPSSMCRVEVRENHGPAVEPYPPWFESETAVWQLVFGAIAAAVAVVAAARGAHWWGWAAWWATCWVGWAAVFEVRVRAARRREKGGGDGGGSG